MARIIKNKDKSPALKKDGTPRKRVNKHIDLSDKIFEKLIVIDHAGINSRSGENMWNCLCECGESVQASTAQLRSGRKISCGCTRRNRENLVGQRIGRWTVIEMIKKPRRTWYKCICDCGNVKEVRACSLIQGKSQSCGCLVKETGKRTIKIAQKAYQEKYSSTKRRSRFFYGI